MEKSNDDKLLPGMEFGSVKAKNVQKSSADIPAELPIDENKDDEDTDDETDSDTDSDSDLDSEYECSICKRKFSGYIPLKQHQKGKSHAKVVARKKRQQKLLDKGAGGGSAEDEDELLVQEPYAVCKTCHKQFSGPESYESHLKCKTHKQKVLEAAILKQVRENGEINIEKLTELCKNKRRADSEHGSRSEAKDENEKTQEEFECKECDKMFTGLTPFIQHLTSKTHEKQIEKKNLLQKVTEEPSRDEKTPDSSKQRDVSTLAVEDDVLVCKVCSTSFSGPENAMTHLKSKKHSKSLDKYFRKLEKKKEKKAKEARPGTEHQNEGTEVLESTTNHPDKPETVDDHEEEIEKPSASGDNTQEVLGAYESYKKYKDLMKSLQEEDKKPE